MDAGPEHKVMTRRSVRFRYVPDEEEGAGTAGSVLRTRRLSRLSTGKGSNSSFKLTDRPCHGPGMRQVRAPEPPAA